MNYEKKMENEVEELILNKDIDLCYHLFQKESETKC